MGKISLFCVRLKNMKQISSIGILGATGDAGKSVALLFSKTNKYKILIGSRNYERAVASANELVKLGAKNVYPMINQDVCIADLVIISTPWETTTELLSPFKDALANKIVLSMVNSLVYLNKKVMPVITPRGSMLAEIENILPESHVFGAFNHLPSHAILKGASLTADILVVGPDINSKDLVLDVINSIDGLRALYVGTSEYAYPVEAFTAVLIGINKNYKAQSSIRITGV